MKHLFAFLLLLSYAYLASASVAIGYSTDKVTTWRYWEIGTSGVPVPKILVYNKSALPVTLYLTKTQPGGLTQLSSELLRVKYHVSSDTFLLPVTLAAHAYGFYNMLALKESGLYDELFIDGLPSGIMPDMDALKLGKYQHRYYSREGINGPSPCLIGVDSLFPERNKIAKMTLSFNCDYKDPRETYWRVSAQLLSGVKAMALQVEGGESYPLDPLDPKVTIPVYVQYASFFTIEVTFKLTKDTAAPNVQMGRSYANGDARFQLPLFVK